MEIVLNTSTFNLAITIVVVVVIISSIWFKKWKMGKKIITISCVLICVIGASFYFLRSLTLNITESGIKLSGQKNIEMKWKEITSVKYIEKYKSTDYKPTLKTFGTALPGYQNGRFRLANEKKAWILVRDSVPDAIFIETEPENYLLSFKDISHVVDEMSKYITVEKVQ